MKINAKFINQHVTDSAHGHLVISLYWAQIEDMRATGVEIVDGPNASYGLLIVGEYEEAAACEGSAYAVFHPLYISGRYFPNSKFEDPLGFSEAMEAALYRAWQANPEGDVEFA